MSTDTLIHPDTLDTPAERVGVVVDDRTMRKSLRFAFANHYTVVQELMQNARRAGATRIDIEYDEARQVLVVQDDGCGLTDFSVLLRFAASGWDQEVTEAEGPYGMGFIACLYAARKEILVVSGDRQIRCSTTALLDGETFPVEPAATPVRGTRVELVGVELKQPAATMQSISRGFAIPVLYNGQELTRPDALDSRPGEFVETPVGHMYVPGPTARHGLIVYLQGFRVYTSTTWAAQDAPIVHLNKQFTGKYPDRDRVIEEDQMLAHVWTAIREVLTGRLMHLKETLSPLAFCNEAYELAKGLNRLDVFNDIDLVPTSWFGYLSGLPHTTTDQQTYLLENAQHRFREDTHFTTDRFTSGELLVAMLDGGFDSMTDSCDWGEVGGSQRIWMMAYTMKALVLDTKLHEDHWLHDFVRLSDEDEAIPTLEIVVPARHGEVPHTRTCRAGGLAVQVCNHTRLQLGQLSCEVHEPWVNWQDGAGRDDPYPVLFVPVGGYVNQDVLRQLDDYRTDDDLDDEDLQIDEREVNHYVRELMADTPHERLQLALRAALDEYRESLKGHTRFTVDVAANGTITLVDAQERGPSPSTGNSA